MYKVTKINDNNSWNSQIEKSPQYSIFCSTLFLDGLKTQFEKYFIYDDKELVMAFCTAIFDDKNKKLFYKDFHPNQSFYFFKNRIDKVKEKGRTGCPKKKKMVKRLQIFKIFLL